MSGLMQWASTPYRLGVARSVCHLILTKLNSYSQGKGNFLVSLNLFILGYVALFYVSQISQDSLGFLADLGAACEYQGEDSLQSIVGL